MTDHKAKPLTRREVLNQCASIRADGHEPLTLAVEPEILIATLEAAEKREAELLARLAVAHEALRDRILRNCEKADGSECDPHWDCATAHKALAATPEALTTWLAERDAKVKELEAQLSAMGDDRDQLWALAEARGVRVKELEATLAEINGGGRG